MRGGGLRAHGGRHQHGRDREVGQRGRDVAAGGLAEACDEIGDLLLGRVAGGDDGTPGRAGQRASVHGGSGVDELRSVGAQQLVLDHAVGAHGEREHPRPVRRVLRLLADGGHHEAVPGGDPQRSGVGGVGQAGTSGPLRERDERREDRDDRQDDCADLPPPERELRQAGVEPAGSQHGGREQPEEQQ